MRLSMPSRTVDAIVLGAGIVGVSAALHLQARGSSVAIVDRLGEAGAETSARNTGGIQSEAGLPYRVPPNLRQISRAPLNRAPRAPIRHPAIPSLPPAPRR